LVVDVTKPLDIHQQCGVTTASVLLEFEGDKPGQIIKGCHEPVIFKAFVEDALYSATQDNEEKTQNVWLFIQHQPVRIAIP